MTKAKQKTATTARQEMGARLQTGGDVEEQVLVQKRMMLAEHQAQLAEHQAQLAEHQAQLAEQVLKNEEEALDDLADAWSSSMAGRTSPAPRNRICR